MILGIRAMMTRRNIFTESGMEVRISMNLRGPVVDVRVASSFVMPFTIGSYSTSQLISSPTNFPRYCRNFSKSDKLFCKIL